MDNAVSETPRSDTPIRVENLRIYNGEANSNNQCSTGFQDEINPVDETIESMATATEIAHSVDDQEHASARALSLPENQSQADDGMEENSRIDESGGMAVNAADMDPNLWQPKKKKKKKRCKPASKRGLGKPTGFEEYHADGPWTPEQHAELKELYDPDLPFADRMLTAIQRFERTRKLSSSRRDIFYKYLAFGGIAIGPNMFQGGIDQQDMDKVEIAGALSQATIPEDVKSSLTPQNTESAKYEIDFEGCMRSFLSYRANSLYGFETREQVQEVTTTLERFMDYLLQHDVCLEYQIDVLSARKLCREATAQLWACAEAHRWLPGDFNIACSTLFDGFYGRNYDGETYWGPETSEVNVFVGLKPEEATQIIGFGIAGAANEQVYREYFEITQNDDRNLEVAEIIPDHGFEIMRIENPTAECKELYHTKSDKLRPVGLVFGRPWQSPDAAPEDLTESEREALISPSQAAAATASDMEHYIFFVEEVVMQFLSVGQKIRATIYRLNCGFWFFDEVHKVYPKFELHLCNEMMLDWKEPKPVEGSVDFVGDQGEEPDEEEGDVACPAAEDEKMANAAPEMA